MRLPALVLAALLVATPAAASDADDDGLPDDAEAALCSRAAVRDAFAAVPADAAGTCATPDDHRRSDPDASDRDRDALPAFVEAAMCDVEDPSDPHDGSCSGEDYRDVGPESVDVPVAADDVEAADDDGDAVPLARLDCGSYTLRRDGSATRSECDDAVVGDADPDPDEPVPSTVVLRPTVPTAVGAEVGLYGVQTSLTEETWTVTVDRRGTGSIGLQRGAPRTSDPVGDAFREVDGRLHPVYEAPLRLDEIGQCVERGGHTYSSDPVVLLVCRGLRDAEELRQGLDGAVHEVLVCATAPGHAARHPVAAEACNAVAMISDEFAHLQDVLCDLVC